MPQSTLKNNVTARGTGTDHELASLVAGAASGSQEAFQLLVSRFQDSIFRTIYFRIRSTMEAQELTQEVFFKAYKKLPGLKSSYSFKSWLFSIALNKIRDHIRKKKVTTLFRLKAEKENLIQEAVAFNTIPEPESMLRRKEFWKTVEMMMKLLSKMEREVFMLRFFDHLEIRQIADTLKKSESTVKTHLYRALAKIRKNPAAATLMEGGLQ